MNDMYEKGFQDGREMGYNDGIAKGWHDAMKYMAEQNKINTLDICPKCSVKFKGDCQSWLCPMKAETNNKSIHGET